MKLRDLFIKRENTPNSVLFLNFFLVAFGVFLCLFLLFKSGAVAYNFSWDSLWDYRGLLLSGFITTLWISLISLAFSFLAGIFLALGQMSEIIFLRAIARSLMETFRGTPLLVQLLVFYYVIGSALQINNRIVVGIIVLSFFEGAYLSEIIRSGIENIGKTQKETAIVIGLTEFQTYFYIIIPQLVAKLLPSIAGQLASIIKDSSLLYVISVPEFTMSVTQVNSYTFSTIEAFFVLALGYFCLTLPISLLSRFLEKKYSYDV